MKKFLKISIIISLILFIVFTAFVVIFINNIMKENNQTIFDKDKLILQSNLISIYDNQDNILTTSTTNGKQNIGIEKLNTYTIDAFLSIEDKNFYEHNGLNYKRIAKAIYKNIINMGYVEGASTISQQLIKNTHLSNEKTLTRKTKEILLTKKLEQALTKDEILEVYLNIIYFGNGSYGIEQASQTYFDKSASDLTLNQSCVLAGLIKAPSTYCPINNYEKCKTRRNLVAYQLLQDQKIDIEQYNDIINKEIQLHLTTNTDPNNIYYQAVINQAKQIINNNYNTNLSDYKIHTYFDANAQNNLTNSIQNDSNYIKNEYGNIADSLAIIIDSNNGGIKAFNGKSKYNLIDIKRQPGSAIKPQLVYSPALDNGLIHNCSNILDEKINIEGYSPHNVGNTYSGYVSVKDCVAKSLNIPAVKLLNQLGIQKAKNYAQKFGIQFSPNDNGLAIALGGFNQGITLQSLVNSYMPYATNGNFIPSSFIKKIEDKNGNIIYKHDSTKNQIISPETSYLTHNLLVEGVKHGTSRRLNNFDFEVAGKTGTVAVKNTNLNTDAISVAYTSQDIMGVWFGNYTYDKQYHLSGSNNGGTKATEIINQTFKQLYQNTRPQNIKIPKDIITLDIDTNNLEQNNIITIADDQVPDIYKSKQIFNKKFANFEKSTTFSNPVVNNFNVKNDLNTNTISFDAEQYYIYEIYCNDKLLNSYDNKIGQIQYIHNDLEYNKNYNYYIKIYSTNKLNSSKSQNINIITKTKYDNIVIDENKQNNIFNWIFN